MFLGAGFLADRVFDKPAAEPVFRAFSLSVPFFTVLGMAASATEGFQTVKYSIRAREVLQPLLNFVLILFFYLLGAQVLGAVAAYVIAMAVASALALYYLKRLFPGLLDRNTPPVFERRAVFGLSGVGLLSYFTEHVNVWAATIVLGIFASAEQVGIYNAAARTALIGGIVYQAFTYIFSPIISNHYSRGLLRDLEDLYRDVCRWIFSGGVVVFFLTVLLSRDILVIFGEEFVDGWLVMDMIALAILFALSVGATNRVLLMTGHQRIYILAFTVATVVGIVGSIVLVPIYGILGAALACATSYVIPNVVTVVGVRNVLNLWPYSRQYLKPLIAGLSAAAVAFTVRGLLPLSTGLLTILVLAPIFLIGFTVMLLSLGLNASDRQFLKAIWMAVRRAG